MKPLLTALLLPCCPSPYRPPSPSGSRSVPTAASNSNRSRPSWPLFSASGAPVQLAQVEASELGTLSHLMHEGHQRCGGYVVHSTLADALQSMAQPISQNLFSARR